MFTTWALAVAFAVTRAAGNKNLNDFLRGAGTNGFWMSVDLGWQWDASADS